MPFSIGMGAASRRTGAPTAFLWGINGAMSVVASVFGALLAMFFGINFTFGAGFVAYAVAAVALALIVRGTRAKSGDGSVDDAAPAHPLAPGTVTTDAGGPGDGGAGAGERSGEASRSPALVGAADGGLPAEHGEGDGSDEPTPDRTA
jgi:hypothetical protein